MAGRNCARQMTETTEAQNPVGRCFRRCLHEIQAVAGLPPHPNVVGQYRAWQQGGHFYIQMDLCEGGSLQQLLRQVRTNIVRLERIASH